MRYMSRVDYCYLRLHVVDSISSDSVWATPVWCGAFVKCRLRFVHEGRLVDVHTDNRLTSDGLIRSRCPVRRRLISHSPQRQFITV